MVLLVYNTKVEVLREIAKRILPNLMRKFP